MAATQKKAAPKATPKFEAKNTEDMTKKPEGVQRLWAVLSHMDPEGDLFVNDKGIIGFDGDVPNSRTPKALKLTKDEVALLRPYAIYDAPSPDDRNSATGVVLTTYQLVEIAYELGAKAERAKVTNSLTAAASDDEDDEDEEDADDLEEDEDESETFAESDEDEEVESDDEDDDGGDEDEEEEEDDDE